MARAAKTAEGPVTLYLVTTFVLDRGRLKAEPPQKARNEAHALALVERFASLRAGVVATVQDIDEVAGEFGELKILGSTGQLPEDFGVAA